MCSVVCLYGWNGVIYVRRSEKISSIATQLIKGLVVWCGFVIFAIDGEKREYISVE